MDCKNCGKEVTADFCGHCGQDALIPRLTVKEIFIQFFDVITKANSSLPGFIKKLFIMPGIVAKEYAEGKRKKYYNPFRYLIFIAGLYAVLNLTNINSNQSYDTSVNESELKSLVKFELFYYNNHKIILLLLLPVAALISWIFFYKSGYNYAENLLLNIIVQSQLILFSLLIITPLIIISTKFDTWIFLFYFLLSMVYFVIAYTQFFSQKKTSTIIISLICFFIFCFLISVMTLIIVDIL